MASTVARSALGLAGVARTAPERQQVGSAGQQSGSGIAAMAVSNFAIAADRSPPAASSLASPASAAGRPGRTARAASYAARAPAASPVARECLAQGDVVKPRAHPLEAFVRRGGDRVAIARDRRGRIALDEGQARRPDA